MLAKFSKERMFGFLFSRQDWNIPKTSRRNFWVNRFDLKGILKGFKFEL